jgi:tRNA pseudouridine55 synthase
MRGFLNIDKPAGLTSFDVVRAIRRASGVRRVGHAGTLDPLATGVLPVAVGDATRLIDALMDARKRYTAEITFGLETDSDDAAGEVIARAPEEAVSALTAGSIAAGLATFVGEHEQRPPSYSAIKRGGVPAYRAARRGEAVDLAPRRVVAYSLELVHLDGAKCTVNVECGKGYYVRALARDLGRILGVGAHISALRRTRVGPFDVGRASALDEAVQRIETRDDLERLLHAPDAVLSGWPAILLDAAEVASLRQGRAVALPARAEVAAGTRARVYGPDGYFESITEYTPADQWRPLRVFRTGRDVDS